MSLKDTIKGAREEVSASGNPFERSGGDQGGSSGSASGDTQGQGFMRRSASRAKPSREQAAGVRVVSSSGKSRSASKSTANMTKAEKKAERQREREKEDRRYAVSQMFLEENPEYQQRHKIWWRMLVTGFAFMVLAIITYMLVNQQGESTPLWLAAISLGSMVLAYIAIIVAFVYDWRTIRPIRRTQESRAASMSDKRINRALRERDKKSVGQKKSTRTSLLDWIRGV